MKAFLTINQKAFMSIAKEKNIKVDYIDGALFDWIKTFTHSQKALKMLIDNKLFIWVSYTAIIDDNPMMNISSNDVVARRLNKLVELGLLEKFLSKKDGNKVFFHITQFAYDYLLESRELPTQKSEGYRPKSRELPTQKSDNSKLIDSYDSKLDRNTHTNNINLHEENKNQEDVCEGKKENPKPKNQENKLYQIIQAYKEKISSKQEKLREMSSYTAITLRQEDFERILIGIDNYAETPIQERYRKNLKDFIRDKIYLDYQNPQDDDYSFEDLAKFGCVPTSSTRKQIGA